MMQPLEYVTDGLVRVTRRSTEIEFAIALSGLIRQLDQRCGAVIESCYEYPGRYSRWAIGFLNAPLEVTTRGDRFVVRAANARGRILIAAIRPRLVTHPHVAAWSGDDSLIKGTVVAPDGRFDETDRTRQPSVFSVIRSILWTFASPVDPHLGLIGAFGYDLIFQMDPIVPRLTRPDDQRDLVAFLPDSLIVVDHQNERAVRHDYDFAFGGLSTVGLERTGSLHDYRGQRLRPTAEGDHLPGEYAQAVKRALPYFVRGDLFEVVPSRVICEPCEAAPSTVFSSLRDINPSPYTFLFSLHGEYLVGASPEMFVRVAGPRVETCPISGTIRRGSDALEDALQIRSLLNSRKDEDELTMCTDVDRNDKSRVCRPGSVQVIGRRQIEMYSHLIHTVDHVEGTLAQGRDALDAFLSHAWAVTVTGAPKRAAITFIEQNERTARRWYGGAIGRFGFNGNLDTGLTLRTLRLKDQIAEIRVGATLLSESDPEAEEQETTTKAAALRAVLGTLRTGRRLPQPTVSAPPAALGGDFPGTRVLLVDCEDSFVHTLASYFAAAGAKVAVLRHIFAGPALRDEDWDLVVFSPGPGRPADFGVPDRVLCCVGRGIPVFGVCLGMQGIVEAFGGHLLTLPTPCHGKPSTMTIERHDRLFHGMPSSLTAGRYHSLHADEASLPASLRVAARSTDGVIMAVEHKGAPVAGVQFHPESIMTAAGGIGNGIIANVVARLARPARVRASA